MSDGDNRDREVNGQGIIARLASKNRGLREEKKVLAAQLEELKAQHTALTQQAEQLRSASDPNGLATKVKELQGELRMRDHRAVFNKLAKAAGVREDGLDDLFALSNYKAEADVADEGAIGQILADQKAKRAYLFQAGGNETNAVTPPAKPAPGSGKGGASTTVAQQISEDLLKNDPAYVMKNYGAVVAAAKAKVDSGQV